MNRMAAYTQVFGLAVLLDWAGLLHWVFLVSLVCWVYCAVHAVLTRKESV